MSIMNILIDKDQYECTLTECQPGEKYKIQLIAQTVIQNEYINNNMIINDKENIPKPDETSSEELILRTLKKEDYLRSFKADFQYKQNLTEQKSLGKMNINWTVSDTKDISHFILQWHSSKDLRIQQQTVARNDTSYTIDICHEKYFYVIQIIIVINDGNRYPFQQLTIPIPGEPDAPQIWLVKTSDTNFTVEWSEPKSYGIPVTLFF